jgi:drug/metabolite transporter (DMT)-like permease
VNKKPFVYVLLSAALFGVSSPIAKLLLGDIAPIALAGLLYLGAFLGLFLYSMFFSPRDAAAAEAERLRKKDLPWLAGTVVAGGIVAPISLMLGLNLISGFSVSLLLNLEGVATAVIAVLFFRENSGRRLWLALICMTAAGVLLSWNPAQGTFNVIGPLLILLAVVGWGVDNNLTRQISDRNPIQITYIKGLAGGAVSLSVALVLGMRIPFAISLLFALLLGSMSYGLSLVFFVKALRGLGSSRTGAFFSLGPFIGAVVSIVVLREWLGWVMLPAFLLMATGVWLIVGEKHVHAHTHPSVTHSHRHRHDDLHHLHEHPEFCAEHTHEHCHPEFGHSHVHWPDTLHRHTH